MPRSKSLASAKISQSGMTLPQYVLDSSLVLLPGIIYNVTFSRFKAAALLARFKEKISSVPVVKGLLAEYDFNSTEHDAALLSPDALDGIIAFYKAQGHLSIEASGYNPEFEPVAEFDWLLLAIFPNTDKIFTPSHTGEVQHSDIATVCRVVGISDDTNNVRLTLQALVRAKRLSEPKQGEVHVTVRWSEKPLSNMKSHLQELELTTASLFALIDSFVEGYRKALASQGKSSDLLTLNPLANALYLQLAGSKDFEKAYSTLQKMLSAGKLSESQKGLLRIIDLTVAIVPFPNHDKLKILLSPTLEDRVIEAKIMAEKMKNVFVTMKENNTLANHWFHNEATNIQRANVVANQLKSIRIVLEGLTKNAKRNSANQKQLVRRRNGTSSASKSSSGGHDNDADADDDDDDLKAITEFIKVRLPEISSISEDSKRLLVKDFRRIKSLPPGNADFHVIRNYLEVVADMPWDNYVSKFKSNKDIDLESAKAQLDNDHYGLEHVKTRLIQYLVVLKLLGINAEREYKKSGAEELEKKRQIQEQRDSRKFTRESANGESFILPNGDEKAVQERDAEISPETEVHQKALLASKHNKSPIIMLAGPPGVGKTSLAKSIATTLGRRFQRISLGGVKDESEIRGHRRTYIGAMAGLIVQALRKARSMNPVILFDEIDKIVGGHNSANKFNGDPAAALLEVLDPEQNTQFLDHYLGFPIDLSQVIFICTANDPYNLSRPLLDRLEMIELGAYDYHDKLVIGSKYLLPRQIKRNGFPGENLVILEEDVMKKVIIDYTREAGVRNFERNLGTICRFKAVEFSQSLSDLSKPYQPRVEEHDLARFLGLPFPSMSSKIVDVPACNYGVVNGLSYNGEGSGSVLIFESIGFKSEKNGPSLNMTGRLGEVLMESAKIGLTVVKNLISRRLLDFENPDSLLEKLKSLEIHMHVPSGAISKDGPSAGITMALLFLSLVMEKPVPLNIAMTGEITLRGLVLPIGGLSEKLLGAHLTGHIDKIIVPRANRRDILEKYAQSINEPERLNELMKDDAKSEFENTSAEDYFAEKYGVRVVYAKEFRDVLREVWGKDFSAHVEQARFEEYHL